MVAVRWASLRSGSVDPLWDTKHGIQHYQLFRIWQLLLAQSWTSAHVVPPVLETGLSHDVYDTVRHYVVCIFLLNKSLTLVVGEGLSL